jgi:hypothetical protein
MKNRFALVAVVIVLLYVTVRFAYAPPMTVTLQAKAWNNGQVHVWHTLNEAQAAYTDVRHGTRCDQLDSKTYKLGSGATAIDYVKVDCNGVSGYVETDQAR